MGHGRGHGAGVGGLGDERCRSERASGDGSELESGAEFAGKCRARVTDTEEIYASFGGDCGGCVVAVGILGPPDPRIRLVEDTGSVPPTGKRRRYRNRESAYVSKTGQRGMLGDTAFVHFVNDKVSE